MKHTILLIIFSIISISGYSQKDQVITLQGDTLIGKVSFTTNSNQTQTIYIKNGKEKMQFKVYEIKSLVKGKNIYHTIKISDQYQLTLLKKEGYLSLYWFMDKFSSTPQQFSAAILIKADGAQLIVPNLGFKKQVGNFLIDCNSVSTAFAEDEYKKSDINTIIDDYNNCIDKNTDKLEMASLKSNLTNEKIDKINNLIRDIEKDGSLTDTESIVEMLNEVSAKIKEGDAIPNFLQNALSASLSTNTDFTNQLNQILD